MLLNVPIISKVCIDGALQRVYRISSGVCFGCMSRYVSEHLVKKCSALPIVSIVVPFSGLT